jgi:predicted ATPase
LVPQALAAVLGAAISSDNPIAGLIAVLHDRRMLIMLDNCEHVVEETALLAEALLLAAPGINIIATSRETLRIRGEWVHRLDSLWTPDGDAASTMMAREAMEWPAVKLFTARCGAALGGFDLNDAAVPVVARICRYLDGIPLAIELAAGRVEQFGVIGLAEMLDDRLRLLVRGRRGAPPRHQTLRATIDWSYDLLSEEEQFALRRISIFKGSFSAHSANAVSGVDTIDLLGRWLRSHS